MNKILFFVLMVSSCKAPSQIKGVNNENRILRNSIVEYIKKDLMTKEEFLPIKDSISFKEYETSIPFDIVSTCEDVISKEYSDDFSFNRIGSNIQLKALATRVRDSLEKMNSNLNNSCVVFQKTRKKQSTQKLKNVFVLFFSGECQDKIYVKTMPSGGVIETNNALEFYGEAYSYLFLLNKEHQITKVYKGAILYN